MSSSPITFANLEAEIVLKLENRVTESTNINRWLRDSVIEISGNPDYRDSFPELEVIGPAFNLTGGPQGTAVQEYAESNFLNSGDYNIKTLDFFIWVDYPTNKIRRQLNPTNYQDSDKFLSSPSLPTEWYRFGLAIGFNPPPNQNYQVQARVQRRHPIIDYFNTQNLLGTTVLLLPNEWIEVLEWCAAMRGFMELLNYERANEIKTLLYGDPAHPNDNPGLIASVKTKRRNEAWMQQQPLRPVVKGSCWGAS
jgi:hypothetical protein